MSAHSKYIVGEGSVSDRTLNSMASRKLLKLYCTYLNRSNSAEIRLSFLVHSLGFVKSTSNIGCVGAERNAPVYSNIREPTRPCTSGIDYFGAEDGTTVKSSTAW